MTLGHTGLKVNRFLGCMNFGLGDWRSKTETDEEIVESSTIVLSLSSKHNN